MPLMLGIETSCDETAAAVVADDRTVLSSVIASQIEVHAGTGGVVPEVASRAHLEVVDSVIASALEQASVEGSDLDGIAVTRGPGLVGALLVGVSAAKALGLVWDKPVYGVNHLLGHLCSSVLDSGRPLAHPSVVLLVSGGHCLLANVEEPGSFEILGATVDDSVGEAYDKVARKLNLGYPGGPVVDRLAGEGVASVKLPRPMLDDGLDFSFSGLKTATIRLIDREPDLSTEDLCAAFVDACMDVLVTKSLRAVDAVDARNLTVVGGVAASPVLRARVTAAVRDRPGVEVVFPPLTYSTDNAAMIAAAGWLYRDLAGPSDPRFGAESSLRFGAW